jgi:hypothetical protein
MQKGKIIKALNEAADAIKAGRNNLLLMVDSENIWKARRVVSEFAMWSYRQNGVVTLVFGNEDLESKLMRDLILQTRGSLHILLVVVTDQLHDQSYSAMRDGQFDLKVTV